MKKSSGKKIILYIGSLARGGAERVVVNLAEYLQKDGYEIVIVTKEQEKVEYKVPHGVRRILGDICGDEIVASRIKNFCNRVKKLRQIWKTEKPDLIVSFIKKNNLMAILSSRGLKVPILVAVRSAAFREYPGLYKHIAKVLFRMADGVIVQTPEQAAYFGKKIKRKTCMLPNPIRPEFMEEVFTGERRDEIVTVGRLDNNKNQSMLVEAFARIASQYPNMKVFLYGDGDRRGKIADLIRKKGLENRVLLAGQQTDVKAKIQGARIFVLTSRVEGIPNAMIEAMALGIVPVSTDFGGGGAGQLIEDGENGFIIPVDDVDALAERLKHILSNPVEEGRMRERAKEVCVRFAPEQVNKQWKRYFEQFIR